MAISLSTTGTEPSPRSRTVPERFRRVTTTTPSAKPFAQVAPPPIQTQFVSQPNTPTLNPLSLITDFGFTTLPSAVGSIETLSLNLDLQTFITLHSTMRSPGLTAMGYRMHGKSGYLLFQDG